MNTETNKAIVRRLIEDAWGGNRTDDLAEYVSSANRLHPGAGGTIPFGPDEMRAAIANFRRGMPDFGCRVEFLVAEGDLAVIHAHFTGTHTEPFAFAGRTLAPSNRTMSVPETLTARINGGKIVEVWATWDRLALLEQLGAA
ncbi:MAG: ester cyclase [Acetobacteraceae bacterium]